MCPWAQNIRQLDLWQRLQALLNGQDMRLVDVRRLLKVASAKINASWWHNSFLPSRDGDFFDDILGLPTGMDVMVGITANEGAFLTSLLGKRDNLLADVLFLHDKSEANDVRQHYGLTGLNSSRSSCWHRTMTKAISDALFVHPLYRQLSKGQQAATKVLVYKYSHRSSQLSLLSSSQLMNDKEAPQDLVSHFDEVLLQFPNKVLLITDVKLSGSPPLFTVAPPEAKRGRRQSGALHLVHLEQVCGKRLLQQLAMLAALWTRG